MARLLTMDGHEFCLPKAPVDFGEDPSLSGAIRPGQGLAARHFSLIPEAGQWVVQDSGSGLGTRVNGRPVQRAVLRGGDVIEAGLLRLRFDDPTAAPPPPPVRLGSAVRAGVAEMLGGSTPAAASAASFTPTAPPRMLPPAPVRPGVPLEPACPEPVAVAAPKPEVPAMLAALQPATLPEPVPQLPTLPTLAAPPLPAAAPAAEPDTRGLSSVPCTLPPTRATPGFDPALVAHGGAPKRRERGSFWESKLVLGTFGVVAFLATMAFFAHQKLIPMPTAGAELKLPSLQPEVRPAIGPAEPLAAGETQAVDPRDVTHFALVRRSLTGPCTVATFRQDCLTHAEFSRFSTLRLATVKLARAYGYDPQRLWRVTVLAGASATRATLVLTFDQSAAVPSSLAGSTLEKPARRHSSTLTMEAAVMEDDSVLAAVAPPDERPEFPPGAGLASLGRAEGLWPVFAGSGDAFCLLVTDPLSIASLENSRLPGASTLEADAMLQTLRTAPATRRARTFIALRETPETRVMLPLLAQELHGVRMAGRPSDVVMSVNTVHNVIIRVDSAGSPAIAAFEKSFVDADRRLRQQTARDRATRLCREAVRQHSGAGRKPAPPRTVGDALAALERVPDQRDPCLWPEELDDELEREELLAQLRVHEQKLSLVPEPFPAPAASAAAAMK